MPTILETHLQDLAAAVSSEDANQRDSLWKKIQALDLDPNGLMKNSKKPRLVLIDEEDLTCRVCLQIFRGDDEIRQCPNGHAFCSTCSKTLSVRRACPTCGVTTPMTGRALLAQTISGRLLATCVLCSEIMSSECLKPHKWICRKTQAVCPFCSDQNVCMDQLKAHLEESHLKHTSHLTWKLTLEPSSISRDKATWEWENTWAQENKNSPLVWIKKITATKHEITLEAFIWRAPPTATVESELNACDLNCQITIQCNNLGKLFSGKFNRLCFPNWWSKDREHTSNRPVRLPLGIFGICADRSISSEVTILVTLTSTWPSSTA